MSSYNIIKACQWRHCILFLIVLCSRSGVDAQNSCNDLNCSNGGFCSESTPGVAKCVCPPLYVGDTCAEKATSLCNADTGKCVNGVACTSDMNGCDCSAATSTFARYMCEETATEYCTEGHFCTNGGTCRSNFGKNLVKSMPGLSGMGTCVCPPETDGTHCETFKFTMIDEQSTDANFKPESKTENPNSVETTVKNEDSTSTVWISVLTAFIVTSGIAMFIIAYRKKQNSNNIPNTEDVYPLDPVA